MKAMTTFRTQVLAGLVAVVGLLPLTACFSLNKGAPVPRQYSLGAAPLRSTVAKATAGVSVGVRRLRLESYLDILPLVVRKGSREITFSEFQRWAEPLSTGINGAVARYIEGRAPIRTVDVAPWPARGQHDYVIQLSVLRFEGVQPAGAASAEAHLLVNWEIIRPGDGVVLARGTTDYRKGGWRAGDYEGLVALLDEGLVALSDALAAKIGELAARPPGSDSLTQRPPTTRPPAPSPANARTAR